MNLNPGEFSATNLSHHARRILAAKGMTTVLTYSPNSDGGFTARNGSQTVIVAGEELTDNYYWCHMTIDDPIACAK